MEGSQPFTISSAYLLCDSHSVVALLRSCPSFCRLVHIVHSIPPTTRSLEAFARFDDDVLYCLEWSLEIELAPQACNQAQLGLKYGGLGFLSPSNHAQAAYIASLCTSLTWVLPSALTLWCFQGEGTRLWAALNRRCKIYFPSSAQTIVSHCFFLCLIEHPQ